VKVLYTTPVATQDLGWYGLIWRIGPHVPQRGSNRSQDPYAPTITVAPRGWHVSKWILIETKVWQKHYVSSRVSVFCCFCCCFKSNAYGLVTNKVHTFPVSHSFMIPRYVKKKNNPPPPPPPKKKTKKNRSPKSMTTLTRRQKIISGKNSQMVTTHVFQCLPWDWDRIICDFIRKFFSMFFVAVVSLYFTFAYYKGSNISCEIFCLINVRDDFMSETLSIWITSSP
jgi:hypothetical protein